MALRRQNLSPTANLLRNSRLFSLPNPLPRPQIADTFGAGTQKVSDTATLPYPTHQAIATTPKSLARGDWGLKRPLPSKSHIVQTSRPVVKVKQLDTIEHVTDYDSAADHVRTRQKFEELSIPMMKGMAALREHASGALAGGAFERRSDVTSYEEDEGLDGAGLTLEVIRQSVLDNAAAKRNEKETAPGFIPFSLPQPDAARHNVRRWKHEGPWLPGMSADEFGRYMTEQLSTRKAEFNKYLRHYVKNSIYTARQAAWRNAQILPDNPLDAEEHLRQQEDESYIAAREKAWSDISNAEIDAGIKKLRTEAATNPLQSDLVQRLIVPFLRIPTIKLKDNTYNVEAKGTNAQYRFDDDVAPLSTHPSAGLGYLRTNAYMANHPILGPQGEHTPVKARVLEPRSVRNEKAAKLGVAGFVANDDYIGVGEIRSMAAVDPTSEIDVQTEGGAKINVLPRYASITNNGRVHIKLTRAKGAEVQVARGELEDRPPVKIEKGKNPLNDLLSFGRSGTQLDAQSSQARDLMQYAMESSNAKDDAAPAGAAQPFKPAPNLRMRQRGLNI